MELYNYAASLFACHHALSVTSSVPNGSFTLWYKPSGKWIFGVLLLPDGTLETISRGNGNYVKRNNAESIKRSLRKIHQAYR